MMSSCPTGTMNTRMMSRPMVSVDTYNILSPRKRSMLLSEHKVSTTHTPNKNPTKRRKSSPTPHKYTLKKAVKAITVTATATSTVRKTPLMSSYTTDPVCTLTTISSTSMSSKNNAGLVSGSAWSTVTPISPPNTSVSITTSTVITILSMNSLMLSRILNVSEGLRILWISLIHWDHTTKSKNLIRLLRTLTQRQGQLRPLTATKTSQRHRCGDA
mmetsp:Transcript_7969/g.11523  ORF Transcript_7969/g.11523 Transcript_7969/m.11523 type:complete len:215 (+) Transcript_7969:587-1231(+)